MPDSHMAFLRQLRLGRLRALGAAMADDRDKAHVSALVRKIFRARLEGGKAK